MIDPIVNLAFSMHKTPGLCALLLGSGISKSVSIPTGQEIRDDLARQVKAISGTDISEDIGYDELLKRLGKTPAERNAILKSYFEPTNEEQEQGLKLPSPAHHAIAQLISSGHIRVVLTTNFDRLLEQALANFGITPNVIRSDDMLEGAMPLRHSPITIVQLHGDYLDLRMLNTPEELSDYSDSKKRLLETIFDEFGLIVCGWSARWDTALRNALLRVKSRRYSTYWVEPFDLSSEAQDLVKQRDATVIPEGSETFFKGLSDTIDSLAKINQQHPLTVAVAVERVKKWIPDESKHIEIEELITETAESSYKNFSQAIEGVESISSDSQSDLHRLYLQHYSSICEVPLKVLTNLVWYGKGQYAYAFKSVVARWAELPSDGYAYNSDPRRIPALLLIYICGIAAIQRNEWRYLRIIHDIEVSGAYPKKHLFNAIRKHTALDFDRIPRSYDYDVSSLLIRGSIRPYFVDKIIQEHVFNNCFDLLEMIIALLSLRQHRGWISHNLTKHYYSETSRTNPWGFVNEFLISGAKLGKTWDLLNQFFDGNPSELEDALTKYRTQVIEDDKWTPKISIPDLTSIYSDNFKST